MNIDDRLLELESLKCNHCCGGDNLTDEQMLEYNRLKIKINNIITKTTDGDYQK